MVIFKLWHDQIVPSLFHIIAKKKTDFIQLMLDLEKNDENEKNFTSEDSETEDKDRINSKPLGSLSSDELTAQGIIFFIAGYDTTSSSLSHVVYYLSVNKECQQRLYEELKDVKEFSYETLSQLKYLCAVIDESLRLSPPLLRIQRQGSHDLEIKGIRIPAGTTIDVLPYALHRDPDLWPDPLEFKPERFLEPRHHPWAYMPFGGGPRVCLGKRFALQEMRMCCAKLFRNYQVDLAPGFKLEYFRRNVILLPKSMKVTLKAR